MLRRILTVVINFPTLGISRAKKLRNVLFWGTVHKLIELNRKSRVRREIYRTLWGVTPILTLPVLAQCDRLLGLKSKSIVFVTYYITKNFDINLRWLDEISFKAARILPGIQHKFRWLVLICVASRVDAVNFFYDRGILHSTERFGIADAEIEFLARCGIRIYTYAYGADVRTRDTTMALGPINVCADCPEPGRFCICSEKDLGLSLSRLDHRITERVAMGDMLSYIPGSRNLHYWPLDLSRLTVSPPRSIERRPLRIAHAPNHSHFKGTHFLMDAVAQLNRDGYAIEVIQISGVPNAKVIELFGCADLVADQFIAGFHGYTALEAMAIGRPVLCFLRGPEMTIAPNECPIINTPPAIIKETLKRILDGEIDLAELGRLSRRFIERHYSVDAVAVRLGRLYLQTAKLPPPISLKVAQRVAEIEAGLPPARQVPPVVTWEYAAKAMVA